MSLNTYVSSFLINNSLVCTVLDRRDRNRHEEFDLVRTPGGPLYDFVFKDPGWGSR